MSFWIDIADLSHITVTPDIPNVQPLAWHGGRLVPPIQLAHDASPTVWELKDGGDRLTDFRTRGLTAIIAADVTGRYDP